MNKNTHLCFPLFVFQGAWKFKIRMSCAVLCLILTGEKQNLPASHCESRSRSPKTQRWLTSLLWRLDLCPPAHPHQRMQRASTPSCSKYWNTGTVSSRIPQTHLSTPPPFCSLPSPRINHLNLTFLFFSSLLNSLSSRYKGDDTLKLFSSFLFFFLSATRRLSFLHNSYIHYNSLSNNSHVVHALILGSPEESCFQHHVNLLPSTREILVQPPPPDFIYLFLGGGVTLYENIRILAAAPLFN